MARIIETHRGARPRARSPPLGTQPAHHGRRGHLRRPPRSASCSASKYLVAFTQTGDSARRMSRLRSPIPLLAFTPDAADPLASWRWLGRRDVPRADGRSTPTRWSQQVDEALLATGRCERGRPRRHRRRLAARHPRLHQRAARAPHRRRGQQGGPGLRGPRRSHVRARRTGPAEPDPRYAGRARPGALGLSAPGRGGGMADTEHSKCSARKGVRVQVPPSAPSVRPRRPRRRGPGPSRTRPSGCLVVAAGVLGLLVRPRIRLRWSCWW